MYQQIFSEHRNANSLLRNSDAAESEGRASACRERESQPYSDTFRHLRNRSRYREGRRASECEDQQRNSAWRDNVSWRKEMVSNAIRRLDSLMDDKAVTAAGRVWPHRVCQWPTGRTRKRTANRSGSGIGARSAR